MVLAVAFVQSTSMSIQTKGLLWIQSGSHISGVYKHERNNRASKSHVPNKTMYKIFADKTRDRPKWHM